MYEIKAEAEELCERNVEPEEMCERKAEPENMCERGNVRNKKRLSPRQCDKEALNPMCERHVRTMNCAHSS